MSYIERVFGRNIATTETLMKAQILSVTQRVLPVAAMACHPNE